MKILAFCLCWLLILTAPGVMAQQTTASSVMAQQATTPNQSSTTPNQPWDLLRQLQAGEKIEVEGKTGKKKVTGKFVSLSDTELVIKRKGKNVSFMRDEVKNIYHVGPPSRKKQVIFGLIGGGVGFLVGSFIALSLALQEGCGDSCVAGALAAFFGIPVAGVFAGLALAGSGNRTLIYSAP